MSRRSDIEASVRDLERRAAAERRERLAAERAAELQREDDAEDRELQRARMRAVHRAAPADRERVDERYELAAIDLQRERATRRPPSPLPDFDAGRGSGSGAPDPPRRATWRDPGA